MANNIAMHSSGIRIRRLGEARFPQKLDAHGKRNAEWRLPRGMRRAKGGDAVGSRLLG